MINSNEIQIEDASIRDAEEILNIQKEAFLGQAHIYNNFRLPPLVQTIESIKQEFAGKSFLKAVFNPAIAGRALIRRSLLRYNYVHFIPRRLAARWLINQIIAAVKFQQSGDLVHIERLIVHPAFQNQGVGSYLMRTLENKFPDGSTFQLFTGEKSERNVHLYTKLGYQVIRKETTEQGIVLVHMEKHHNKNNTTDLYAPA